MSARSCDELGVCQGRTSDCAGCRPFAPGVLVASRRPAPRWRRVARLTLLWAWRVISIVCVLIVLLGVVGLVNGRSAGPVGHVHMGRPIA